MRLLPLPESVWTVLEPLIPLDARVPTVPHRRVLEGIVYALRNEIALCDLPADFACGSPRTIGRRIERWRRCGCLTRIVATLENSLPDGRRLNWSRVWHVAEPHSNSIATPAAMAR